MDLNRKNHKFSKVVETSQIWDKNAPCDQNRSKTISKNRSNFVNLKKIVTTPTAKLEQPVRPKKRHFTSFNLKLNWMGSHQPQSQNVQLKKSQNFGSNLILNCKHICNQFWSTCTIKTSTEFTFNLKLNGWKILCENKDGQNCRTLGQSWFNLKLNETVYPSSFTWETTLQKTIRQGLQFKIKPQQISSLNLAVSHVSWFIGRLGRKFFMAMVQGPNSI